MSLRDQYRNDYLWETRLEPGSWTCELCGGRFSWQSPTLLQIIDEVACHHMYANHIARIVPDA